MGPIPTTQFSSPDDPDTAATATAAVPGQETTPSERTQSVTERKRVRPAEAEADGAPPVQRTRTAVSVAGTSLIGTTSEITTSPPMAPVERVGN